MAICRSAARPPESASTRRFGTSREPGFGTSHEPHEDRDPATPRFSRALAPVIAQQKTHPVVVQPRQMLRC